MSVDRNTPALSRVAHLSKLTSLNLSDITHPVNEDSKSGKSSGMCIMIGDDIYLPEGSNPESSWFRLQRHIEPSLTILRGICNTTVTSVIANDPLEIVNVSMLPVETFLLGDWLVNSSTFEITYTGSECIFNFRVSGDARTDDSAGTGDNISVELFDEDSNNGLTGATKTMPVTKVQGGVTAIVDFTLDGYARVNTGDVFRLQIGENFSGALLVNNLLLSITPTDALMYN